MLEGTFKGFLVQFCPSVDPHPTNSTFPGGVKAEVLSGMGKLQVGAWKSPSAERCRKGIWCCCVFLSPRKPAALVIAGFLPSVQRLQHLFPGFIHQLWSHHLGRDGVGSVQPFSISQRQPGREVSGQLCLAGSPLLCLGVTCGLPHVHMELPRPRFVPAALSPIPGHSSGAAGSLRPNRAVVLSSSRTLPTHSVTLYPCGL